MLALRKKRPGRRRLPSPAWMHACMDAGGRAASGTGRRGGRAASGTKAGTAENLNSKDTIAEVKAELAGDIAALDQKLSGKIAELDKNMAVLKWMMGATLTGVAAIIVKIFFVA